MTRRADSEKGASLLSVLVIVMLMSAAAVAATDALARSVSIAKSSGARSETFWTARSASDVAAAYLTKAMATTEGVLNAESDLLANPITLPAGHGLVVFQLREASNCFNLNALFEDKSGEAVGEGSLSAYRDLLVATGLNKAEAESLGEKLADWIDTDHSTRSYGAEDSYYASQSEPYRPANTRLRNISELKSIAGYDADVMERIDGLVCLRPGIDQSKLNINTLSEAGAPLLVALFSSELSDSDALSLIQSRPVGGWSSLDAFMEEPEVKKISPDALRDTAVSIASSFLAADIDIGTGDLVTSYQALYVRAESGTVSRVSMVRRDF